MAKGQSRKAKDKKPARLSGLFLWRLVQSVAISLQQKRQPTHIHEQAAFIFSIIFFPPLEGEAVFKSYS